MYKDLPPLKTWQFFHACRKTLGISFIQKVYKKSVRQIYRWSADPVYADQVENNPLDRIKVLLEKLCEIGREDIAISAVSILAETTGHELKRINPVLPDKATIEDECLDDYPALVKFHQVIRDARPREEISYWWQAAKQELDETYQKYLDEKDRPDGIIITSGKSIIKDEARKNT